MAVELICLTIPDYKEYAFHSEYKEWVYNSILAMYLIRIIKWLIILEFECANHSKY